MSSTVLDMLSAISGVLPAIDDGSLRLSYADVQRSVAAERRWFQSMKVRRCALLAENSSRWILSDLALLASEAVNVPLLPSLGHERVAQVLEDAGIEWVQAIDAASPDSMVLTPELLHALVEAIRDGWRVPESVKCIAVGGVVSPELFQEARHAGLPHRDAEVRSVDLGAIDAGRFVYLRDPVRNVSCPTTG